MIFKMPIFVKVANVIYSLKKLMIFSAHNYISSCFISLISLILVPEYIVSYMPLFYLIYSIHLILFSLFP